VAALRLIFVIQQHSDRLGHIRVLHMEGIASALAWKKLVLLRQKLISSGRKMKLRPLFPKGFVAHIASGSVGRIQYIAPGSETHHFAVYTREHNHTWLVADHKEYPKCPKSLFAIREIRLTRTDRARISGGLNIPASCKELSSMVRAFRHLYQRSQCPSADKDNAKRPLCLSGVWPTEHPPLHNRPGEKTPLWYIHRLSTSLSY